MEDLIARVRRIQQDFQTLSKELDDVLKEHSPKEQEPPQQIILPARKRGRPKKAENEAREAAKEVKKAEDAAAELVKEKTAKKIKKLKKPESPPHSPPPPPPPAICRTCGIDVGVGADHRRCFFGSGFQSSSEWMHDCVAYAEEIGAGVAYTP